MNLYTGEGGRVCVGGRVGGGYCSFSLQPDLNGLMILYIFLANIFFFQPSYYYPPPLHLFMVEIYPYLFACELVLLNPFGTLLCKGLVLKCRHQAARSRCIVVY